MADLFDTDAISEVQRKKPSQRYAAWLRTVPREEQFTSAVSVGELYEALENGSSTWPISASGC
jgi:predicted nucleic acid-binding protein